MHHVVCPSSGNLSFLFSFVFSTALCLNNQSVHPDGPSMRPPQKEICIAGKKEGLAVRRTDS
jgi:hypothetical protein